MLPFFFRRCWSAVRYIPWLAAISMPLQARAQDATPPKWQFYFTPYLWVSGLSGTTSTSNPNVPSQTGSASFGDLLSHLNSIPVMGSAEVRYDRFGLLTDIMGVSLKSGVATKGVAFSSANATVTELLATILPSYRVLDFGNQSLDLGVGVRVVAYWTKLTFDTGLLPGFSRSPSLSWATPIFGLRYHYQFPSKFGLTFYGDAGAVNGDNVTWQLVGSVDYRYNDWITLRGGYRHLHIDYDSDVLHTSTALSGPIIGATMRF
jgi:hypothetical protein